MQMFYTMLKDELKKKKITQKEGAEKLGMSRSWFNKKINGKVGEFTLKQLAILYNTFKININKLLSYL